MTQYVHPPASRKLKSVVEILDVSQLKSTLELEPGWVKQYLNLQPQFESKNITYMYACLICTGEFLIGED